MYEDETYEALLERALNRVPDAVDKREGYPANRVFAVKRVHCARCGG